MADEKECFIIMPITTPDLMLTTYRDGKDHFKHVLECLFIPAITEAGFKPIPPKAKGADLIHAEIIKNLETSALVLCDISSLNPNVFFELGIRTSLNKSVCVVKDELTKKVPFDTGILNHHEYQCSLETWHIKDEIEKLSAHIITSAERSKNENTLWKYFGFKSEAVPYVVETGTDAKINYITMQLDSMRQKLDDLSGTNEHSKYQAVSATKHPTSEEATSYLGRILPPYVKSWTLSKISDGFAINTTPQLSHSDAVELRSAFEDDFGMNLEIKLNKERVKLNV